MSPFASAAKHPAFLRTAAGAVTGGAFFYRAAEARDRHNDDTSLVSKAMTTALGVMVGAGLGAAFPQWKGKVAGKFKQIHASYGPNLERAFQSADEAFKTSQTKALRKGQDISKIVAPQRTDLAIRGKAALETYMKPSIVLPTGMVLGAAYASSRGQNPLSGAADGALVTGGAGLAYHSYMAYRGIQNPLLWKSVGATLGVAAAPMAYMAGVATNDPEYGGMAAAMPSDDGYYTQDMYRSGAGRRAEMIGATGDLVFGLQNMRHG